LTEAGGEIRHHNWRVAGLFLLVLLLVALCDGFVAQDKSAASQDLEGVNLLQRRNGRGETHRIAPCDYFKFTAVELIADSDQFRQLPLTD
jgi:hypothetical protein